MKRIVLTIMITIFTGSDFAAQSNDLRDSRRPAKNKNAEVSRKSITEKDYNDRMRQASITTSKKAVRSVSIQTIYKDGKVVKTIQAVNERDLYGHQRIHTIENGGEKERETDLIIAEGFQYSRVDGGGWKRVDLSAIVFDNLVKSSRPKKRESLVSTYFEKPGVLGGRPARILINQYVWKSRDKFMESRWWISDDGLFLRQETTEGTVSTHVVTTQWVNVYHYDSHIKIEAPIE